MSDIYETKGEFSSRKSKERHVEVGEGFRESNALQRLIDKIRESQGPKSGRVSSGRADTGTDIGVLLVGIDEKWKGMVAGLFTKFGVPREAIGRMVKGMQGLRPEQYAEYIERESGMLRGYSGR